MSYEDFIFPFEKGRWSRATQADQSEGVTGREKTGGAVPHNADCGLLQAAEETGHTAAGCRCDRVVQEGRAALSDADQRGAADGDGKGNKEGGVESSRFSQRRREVGQPYRFVF